MTLILLVDDELVLMTMLQALLEEEGYVVQTARHGREALQCLAQTRPALVISDFMMPHMDGTALYAAMQANPAWQTIPFILFSAVGQPKHFVPRSNAAFLLKPFDLEQLLGTIAQLIALP